MGAWVFLLFCFVCLSVGLGSVFVFKHLLPENTARVLRTSQCQKHISLGVTSLDAPGSTVWQAVRGSQTPVYG